MERLGLEIPQFKLKRSLVIRTAVKRPSNVVEVRPTNHFSLSSHSHSLSPSRPLSPSFSPPPLFSQVSVAGTDNLGHPFSFVKEVTVSGGEKKVTCSEEPFKATVGVAGNGGGVAVEVMFHAHYGEPVLTLPVRVGQSQEMVSLSFDPLLGHWDVLREGDKVADLSEKMEAASL